MNEITLSGTYDDVYGGWTTGTGTDKADRNDSHNNKLIFAGGAAVNIYGGCTESDGGKAYGNTVFFIKTGAADPHAHVIYGGRTRGITSGEASSNTVTVNASGADAVWGGHSDSGAANGNVVNLNHVTVGAVIGGTGVITTNDNIVNMNSSHVDAALRGGSLAGTGNTLNTKGRNSAGLISGFQTMNFDLSGIDAAGEALYLTSPGEDSYFDWNAIHWTNSPGGTRTLIRSNRAMNFSDFVQRGITLDKTEQVLTSDTGTGTGVRRILINEYTYRDAAAYADGDMGGIHNAWGGRSELGNSTRRNNISISGGLYSNIYGGYTRGAGTTAADKNDSHDNTVSVTGDTTANIYGCYTASAAGRAYANTVGIDGYTVTGNVTGGYGSSADGNVIRLKSATVAGTVTGGSINGTPGGTNNTLAAYYGTRTSMIQDFAGVQNLHFYLENAPRDPSSQHALLRLNAAGKDIAGIAVRIGRDGGASKLEKGDRFTLMEAAAAITNSDPNNIKAEGLQGVSRRYKFDVVQDENDNRKLVAIVRDIGLNEKAKSLVETRTAAAALIDFGSDFLVDTGIPAAESAAAASTVSDERGGTEESSPFVLWAGLGGGNMRYETGSYVDQKGWHLGVGWSRTDKVKAGELRFSPFIEYGRGSYDSWLDDGTHGNGKNSCFGIGVFGKLRKTGGRWIEASLRGGHTRSDYNGNIDGENAEYDSSNNYIAAHLGAGKTFRLRTGDALDAYARYFYSHTRGTETVLSTGEHYHFDPVNSHRLRLGVKYTHTYSETSQFYAGLAWEHEFGGEAGASYDGEGIPSPSLKGSSAMVELGCRFTPTDSRMNYDFHLMGWQGKRKGITGGISVKWMF